MHWLYILGAMYLISRSSGAQPANQPAAAAPGLVYQDPIVSVDPIASAIATAASNGGTSPAAPGTTYQPKIYIDPVRPLPVTAGPAGGPPLILGNVSSLNPGERYFPSQAAYNAQRKNRPFASPRLD